MGDDVKITVIATGFRDQMPERRARMLSVEEAPVLSVPVVAPESSKPEPKPVAELPRPHDPTRFLSQDEEEKMDCEDLCETLYFSASTPAVATTVSVAAPRAHAAPERAPIRGLEQPEPVPMHARPQFEEISEEPAHTHESADYAEDYGSGHRGPVAMEQDPAAPAGTLFPEPAEEPQVDLDQPAFLRRLRF